MRCVVDLSRAPAMLRASLKLCTYLPKVERYRNEDTQYNTSPQCTAPNVSEHQSLGIEVNLGWSTCRGYWASRVRHNTPLCHCDPTVGPHRSHPTSPSLFQGSLGSCCPDSRHTDWGSSQSGRTWPRCSICSPDRMAEGIVAPAAGLRALWKHPANYIVISQHALG